MGVIKVKKMYINLMGVITHTDIFKEGMDFLMQHFCYFKHYF